MKDFFHLHRLDDADEGFEALGVLTAYVDGKAVLTCRTLEPAWKGNATGTSCIPLGLYPLRHYLSKERGRILAVDDVPGRQLIRIHAGNYRRDTRGCILPGATVIDVDGDGHRDVTGSKAMLARLLALVPEGGCKLLVTADKGWDA